MRADAINEMAIQAPSVASLQVQQRRVRKERKAPWRETGGGGLEIITLSLQQHRLLRQSGLFNLLLESGMGIGVSVLG